MNYNNPQINQYIEDVKQVVKQQFEYDIKSNLIKDDYLHISKELYRRRYVINEIF